jgi:hypothetical protein
MIRSRTILRRSATLATALVALFSIVTAPAARGGLEETFRQPPDSAKPWTYWFWINGNITKEGITADLEAMARVGIGGVLIMEVANPKTMAPAVFKDTALGTQLPVRFDPAGSVFVVFRQKANPATQITKVARDGSVLFGAERQTSAGLPQFWVEDGKVTALSREPGRFEVVYASGSKGVFVDSGHPAALAVSGPWTVQFQTGRGAPPQAEFAALADWSKHTDSGIRYFSGTATYITEFDWAPSSGTQHHKLDLGAVQVMAEVRLNGKDLGILWKPPYAVDASKALKPGSNKLEVKVTNLWPNRLIGDEQFPEDCTADGSWKTGPIPAWPEWFLKGQPRPEPRRLTFTTWKYYTKDSPLLPSGLLGPVRVLAEGDRHN